MSVKTIYAPTYAAMLRGDPPITRPLTMMEKILSEISAGDLNTLERFHRWASTQDKSEALEIMEWSAEYRKAELARTYPMPLSGRY